MATGRTYGAKEFSCVVGIQDISEAAIGTAPATGNFVTGTKIQMGLSSINDIAWDGGYQRAEISRTGRRVMRAEDIISHYGSGTWTWDFDWISDNEMGIQKLLNLIYPQTTTVAGSVNGMVIPANPLVDDMKHGNTADKDTVAAIMIKNPDDDEDRLMHSAVLQNLTLSMDAGSNGGRLNASGQFYSGYKPVIGDHDFAADSSASDFARGIFDCTVHTIGGTDASVQAFNVTISNPATRVGFQGSSGEADGYVRAGDMSVTGSITVKADDAMMGLINSWQSNSTVAILLEAGTASQIAFHIPAANMSGHNLSIADEGTMLEIPFTATSGADSTGNVITIKAT